MKLSGAAIILILAQLTLAQANIDRPAPQPPSAKQATKADPYCASTPEWVDGEMVFTDCHGKKRRSSSSEGTSTAGVDSKGQGSTGFASDDPLTRKLEAEADQADYEYHIFSKQHAKRTFDFQYWTGEVIFWVVLTIVFAGLFLSAVQFYVGLRHPLEARAVDQKTAKADDPSVSEFEASLQGIKLKSSVLGLLILAMSMVFFYLYLKYVYPITSVSP